MSEIKSRDTIIILATGRPHEACSYLLQKKLVDCIVSANGALTMTKDKILYSEEIPFEMVSNFLEFTLKNSMSATFYSESMTGNGIHSDNLMLGLKESMNIDSNKLKNIQDDLNQPIFLMCAFIDSSADQILQRQFPNMIISRWHNQIVSILYKEVTKVTGISKALEYYSILPSECVAVGDGTNDIEMLKYSGYGIAVGRENKKLVDISDKVIDKVDSKLLSVIF